MDETANNEEWNENNERKGEGQKEKAGEWKRICTVHSDSQQTKKETQKKRKTERTGNEKNRIE